MKKQRRRVGVFVIGEDITGVMVPVEINFSGVEVKLTWFYLKRDVDLPQKFTELHGQFDGALVAYATGKAAQVAAKIMAENPSRIPVFTIESCSVKDASSMMMITSSLVRAIDEKEISRN